MMELWITVEVMPGCEIREAIDQAIKLARRTGVGVRLPFNGRTLSVNENSVAEEVVRRYWNKNDSGPR